MSFWKNLHPLLRKDKDDYGSANSAILNAIDTSLSDAERAEVATKVQRSLDTATGEYLDYWGRWFNSARRYGETDDAYRERIKYYLLMGRGTVQDIIDGLKYWLQDNALYAEVYEPWYNIFTLNKSKLNGEDSIAGSYYRYTVIDVKLDRPISKEILDIIYAYKPAGVIVYTTYEPNLNIKANALSLANLNTNFKEQTLSSYGGIGDYGGNIIGFGDLDETAMQSMNHTLFTTNDSKTNGEDYVSGNIFKGNGGYYVGLSGAHRNLFTGTSDKPSTKTGGNWNIKVISVYKTPKVGQEYTLSVEVPEADHDVRLEVYRLNNAAGRMGMALSYALIKSGGKAHVTFTWPDPGDSGATYISANLAWTNGTDTGTYSYCKAKLEQGNIATDWSPAPEDNVVNLPDSSSTWIQDGIRQATKLEDNVKSGNIFNNGNNNIFGEIRIQEFLLSKYSENDSGNILSNSTLSPYIEASGVLSGNANIVISQVSYPILNGRTLIPIKVSDIIKDSTGISKIPFCLIGEEGTTLDLDKIVFGYKFLREKEAGVAVSADHVIKPVSIPPIVGTAVVGETKL